MPIYDIYPNNTLDCFFSIILYDKSLILGLIVGIGRYFLDPTATCDTRCMDKHQPREDDE